MKFQSVILALLALTANADIGIRCGTQEAHEVFLDGAEKARPSDGPLFINTPNFIVHYDTIGIHACTPAYAESTAVYAENVRMVQVGGFGFAAPPPDFAGPDSRYDIYIRYINPYYGQSWTEDPYPDPYPTGSTSYILLRNTMTWDQLRATVAHEFNHGCQKRYSNQYNWWYENVACWAEDLSYDGVNWYILSLNTSPNPLANPHLSVDNTTNEFEYASQIWVMFLDEYYGRSSIRLFWEEIGQVGGGNVLDAINTVLLNYDSDLEMALGNYAVWRYFTGVRADTDNYFHESDLWPTSYVNPIHQHTGPGSGNQGSEYLDGPGGTGFIEFYTSPDYLLKTSLTGGPGGDWRVYSVGCNSASGHMQYIMDSDDCWSVMPTALSDTIVLIPTVTSLIQANAYSYTGEALSSNPTPPDDPELEISTILSPSGTYAPYSSAIPSVVLQNNASNTTIDSAWVSFYVGDWYSDSRVIESLAPGDTDTASFVEWTSLERHSLDVHCVGGGYYDAVLSNNYLSSSALVTLSDFEILEILSPRGVVAKNTTITPSVIIQNNGTSNNTVSVTFSVGNYTDEKSIYLEPSSSGELLFEDWLTPTQVGACSTSCSLTIPDQRPCNDIIIGEVLVLYETGIEEEAFNPTATFLHSPVPNPFTSITSIDFQLAEPGYMMLNVFDLSGRLVETLEDRLMEPGEYSVLFDRSDLSNGIYLIQLTTESASCVERCVLIR